MSDMDKLAAEMREGVMPKDWSRFQQSFAALLDERARDKALMHQMAEALEEHMEELEQYTSLESPGEKRGVAVLAAYREQEGK